MGVSLFDVLSFIEKTVSTGLPEGFIISFQKSSVVDGYMIEISFQHDRSRYTRSVVLSGTTRQFDERHFDSWLNDFKFEVAAIMKGEWTPRRGGILPYHR
jgi:hypothetical protein